MEVTCVASVVLVVSATTSTAKLLVHVAVVVVVVATCLDLEFQGREPMLEAHCHNAKDTDYTDAAFVVAATTVCLPGAAVG